MTPIRVAIIGLSANATTDWAQRAHLPYLLSPRGRERFQIFALCNSSVAAAKKSIKAFHLPPATRAYGSPEDLAADSDVQLVICATRVDKHYDTSMPSVRAGKDVFIEWPLAENAVRTDELLKAADKAGGRTIVGLQVCASIDLAGLTWLPCIMLIQFIKGLVCTFHYQAQRADHQWEAWKSSEQ